MTVTLRYTLLRRQGNDDRCSISSLNMSLYQIHITVEVSNLKIYISEFPYYNEIFYFLQLNRIDQLRYNTTRHSYHYTIFSFKNVYIKIIWWMGRVLKEHVLKAFKHKIVRLYFA